MKSSQWLDPEYGYTGGDVWAAVEHIPTGRITVQKGCKLQGKWFINGDIEASSIGCTVIGCYPMGLPPTYERENMLIECSLCGGNGTITEYDYTWTCPQCGSNED